MITTSTGTTVSVEKIEDDRVVLLSNPKAPEDMRQVEAGRIIEGSFQAAFFMAFAMSPEVLRAIADLAEKEPL